MNTIQLKSFMAVANFLNFSRAADHMCLTQPAISHQIGSLEDELGVKLFSRTSKNVRLTDEGSQFMHYAEEMLRIEGLSKARMKSISLKTSRKISIGVHNTFELRLLEPVLRMCLEDDPDLVPIIRMMPFDSLESMLLDGNMDLIFSFTQPKDRNLRLREVIKAEISAMLNPTNSLASRSFIAIDDLRGAGRIATCMPPYCPDEIFHIQGRMLETKDPDDVIIADNLEVLESLVATGYAFACVIDIKTARKTGIAYVPIKDVPMLPFGVLVRKNDRSTVLDDFILRLSESLQG